jgi:seryl-tRNA synthetase
MLDIKTIRSQTEDVKRAVQVKGSDVDIDRLLAVDSRRRQLTQESEQFRARRNELSKQIPKLSNEERLGVIAEVKGLKTQLAALEEELGGVQTEYRALMLDVPQIPHPDAPVGVTEDDNVVLRHWGTPREFDFEPRSHEVLGELLGIIDKPRAAKFAGGRSYLLRGPGALLELAVLRLALDIVMARGFTPILGPLMVNEAALMGTGFFPHGKEEVYHLEKDDKWLIGTSEVHLVAMHMDEVLSREELPLLYTGYSPCFRREAGSYGRDTRGVYRVHQFSKVEQVVICRADEEENTRLHDFLVENAERVLQALELPHRVAAACTGEMGQGKYKMYEVETWMPSRAKYSETHSCSSLKDFQARRLNIRYKDEDGKTQVAWTLNNTAVASPRILIPLLETHQNEDGSVELPKALHPYMNGLTRIEPVSN